MTGPRAGANATAARIGLGGIELEYCQPLREGALADHLQRFGPGVVRAEFAVPSLDRVRERIPANSPWQLAIAADLLGEDRPEPRWQLSCRDVVGFDVVLEESAHR